MVWRGFSLMTIILNIVCGYRNRNRHCLNTRTICWSIYLSATAVMFSRMTALRGCNAYQHEKIDKYLPGTSFYAWETPWRGIDKNASACQRRYVWLVMHTWYLLNAWWLAMAVNGYRQSHVVFDYVDRSTVSITCLFSTKLYIDRWLVVQSTVAGNV